MGTPTARTIRPAENVLDYIRLNGTDAEFVVRKVCSVPTSTRPGSPARIRVYAQRVARGEPLFHPDDCVMDGPSDFGVIAKLILPPLHRRRRH